jgi:iron complex transport system ATP-binding protein
VRRRHLRLPGPIANPLVEAIGLWVHRGRRPVLRDLSVAVRPGEFVAVVGPNGSGKSTLVGALAGDLSASAGHVQLDGKPVGAWRPVELAMRRAVLPQDQQVAFPFTVSEVVSMGRSPWAGTARHEQDTSRVLDALVAMDALELADRRFPTLSGGERARVAMARALAQDAPLLLLDEPLAALDLHHQVLVLTQARHHAAAGGAVVAVIHDLSLAAAHADRMLLLDNGSLVADGTPAEVLEPEQLSRVYRHWIDVLTHPLSGSPLVAAAPAG